ncbi:MAG: beta-galactosidase, partial [Turicibacter sanguinis]
MKTFEVKEEFLVDGKPTRIMSGAIHYFRIMPDHWEH